MEDAPAVRRRDDGLPGVTESDAAARANEDPVHAGCIPLTLVDEGHVALEPAAEEWVDGIARRDRERDVGGVRHDVVEESDGCVVVLAERDTSPPRRVPDALR